jgi:trehalose synthase
MARRVDIKADFTLDDHMAVADLAGTVRALQGHAARIAPRFEGRTLWMINSTEHGGGVAEMLPALVTLLRELGIHTEWLVLEADDPRFFVLTKRLHNLIHGIGDPALTEEDRLAFEATNRRNAEVIRTMVQPGDIVAVHDPQPMPLAAMLREHVDIRTLWRCHIGLDERNEATNAAWRFLRPYAAAYDASIFSAPEYIPRFVERAHVVHPSIDPLTAKNMHLGLHHTVQILANGGLLVPPGPVLTDDWDARAERLQADGTFAAATEPEDIGLLTRPIITQVSRWDVLKGFLPLMHGFAELKRRLAAGEGPCDGVPGRRAKYVRLVLAGPDPDSVADDPEGQQVLRELCDAYVELPAETRSDIALVTLPMKDTDQNALLVNALHRVSTIVAQNSLREGFGLTITEAMWKRVPVLSNSRAVGPRHQLHDGVEGRLIRDPENTAELADAMLEMLCDTAGLEAWARAAQHRAREKFLIFGQLEHWLERVADLADR